MTRDTWHLKNKILVLLSAPTSRDSVSTICGIIFAQRFILLQPKAFTHSCFPSGHITFKFSYSNNINFFLTYDLFEIYKFPNVPITHCCYEEEHSHVANVWTTVEFKKNYGIFLRIKAKKSLIPCLIKVLAFLLQHVKVGRKNLNLKFYRDYFKVTVKEITAQADN